MSRPVRILAFWPASDYPDFFCPAFLNRPDFEVEIVTGDRTSTKSAHKATLPRLCSLRRRVAAGEFDLVISGNIWNTPWPANKGWWTSVAQAGRFFTYKRSMLDCWWVPWVMGGLTGKVPLAVVDLRDPNFILPSDFRLLKACTHYFKRELFAWPWRSLQPLCLYMGRRRVEQHASKLLPLSYGVDPGRIPQTVRPMAQRDIDIFFSGMGNPVRDHLRERCRRLASNYRARIADKKLSWDEYVELLGRSRLVVCTESFGCETWRQYEAASYGAVPLLNYPFVLHHQPMVPDEHAVFFSLAGQDFERQVDRVLADPALLEKISRQTREYAVTHKDRRRVGDYIVNTALGRQQE